jgi:transketolase C-terminal domain/subunit
LGFSHWAEEDLDVLSALPNIKCYKPKQSNNKVYKEFLYNGKPSYLNLKR